MKTCYKYFFCLVMLSAPKLSAQEIDKEKLAAVFAHLKNAWLAIEDGKTQDMQVFIAWANGQDPLVVRREASKTLNKINGSYLDVKVKEFCLSYSHLKEARQILLTSASEGTKAHLAHCLDISKEERTAEYEKSLQELTDYFD
jgi:hypothetical protein